MGRFTLPRDLYHGEGSLAELKNLKGKKAVLVLGGGSMKRFGFVDKAVGYLKEAGMEVRFIENVEPDPSVETVMKGAEIMREFQPDWIVAMGGGSPIDAAKAMWVFYEYPETSFEAIIQPFSFPSLRTKAKFCAIPSTSGTATEVTAFAVITDYAKGIKYPLADFNITPDVAIVDPALAGDHARQTDGAYGHGRDDARHRGVRFHAALQLYRPSGFVGDQTHSRKSEKILRRRRTGARHHARRAVPCGHGVLQRAPRHRALHGA